MNTSFVLERDRERMYYAVCFRDEDISSYVIYPIIKHVSILLY